MADKVLQSALWYAKNGFYIFPLGENKRPLIDSWGVKATRNPEVIKGWWEHWPDANIGIGTKNSHLVVLDVDVKDGAPGLKNWIRIKEKLGGHIENTVIVETPSGGFHYWYRAHGAKIGNSGLAKGIDVRAAGGKNGGQVPAPPSAGYGFLDGHSPLEIDILPLPVELKEMLANRQEQQAPDIDGPIPTSKRNTTLASLAGSMSQRGLPKNVTRSVLHKVNEELCEVPLPPEEIDRITIYEPEPQSESAEEKSTALASLIARIKTSEEFATEEPPEVDWIVHQVLESNGMAMIYGDSGIGKTFLAMDLAASIGRGGRWFGRNCKKSKVLYLDGENGGGLLHRRSRMIDSDGDADVGYLSFPDFLLDDVGLFMLEELIIATQSKVVVLDPLMNFMKGDENAIQDIRPQISGLRELGDRLEVAIILIHHENRGGTYRGSSGFKDLVTLQLHLVENKENGTDWPHSLEVLPKKQRQSLLEPITIVWKVMSGEFLAMRSSEANLSPAVRVTAAAKAIRTETGQWPGTRDLVRGKKYHHLSRTQARRGLKEALADNMLSSEKAAHNRTLFKAKDTSINVDLAGVT